MGLENSALVRKYVNVGEKRAGSTSMGIFVGLFAAFGGILFGYDTGTISGIMAMPYVLARFPKNIDDGFSSSESSLIVSILSVGTFFGALLAPFLSDTLGRRWTLIISSLIVFNLGIILQTAADAIPMLCAGRAIAGFGVGLISASIPLYQSECAPKWIRGAIVSCYQFAITIGILLAACVNEGTKDRNDSGSYRIPIAVQFLWALILGGGLFFLPETPRFWVSKGQEAKARDSLSRLRRIPADHPDLIEEYDDIKASFDFEMAHGTTSWLDCFSKRNRQVYRLFTGIWLQAFQQLTGINFIFYYGTPFFQSAGIKNPFTISIATNIVNVFMTLPGVVLIETAGRRKVLIYGAVCMCVSELLIAIVGVAVSEENKSANKVLVAFTCTFIAAFASTWGPCCWAVVGEIFPLRTRAKSVAMSTASNWLWNWAIAYATPYLVNTGPGNAGLQRKVFFIWGGCNFLCILFAWAFVMETKGLTLEQVDELYETVASPWKSSTFVPSAHAFQDEGVLHEDAYIKDTNDKAEVETSSV
ncbi:low-affinity glucose transporter Hxt3p [[Candida] railenensis]|uniref:Low-affinity glucose transporter Hxt3p n=1 Tax=[Candida] railenensis TaxID=45579 RepID=A0A9P0QRJ0_9ASCO|nr:low-affinity glucose transporter Hxt3p [[Candida] railenensis]